ncbi:MAG: 4Fe-4S dicluster domain-containing protein [Dysgonamonadaceae bacterium]|jgi:NAD-dependent dihydropyrimidine dehydrogenase PreA subunit|nr:4Fe-4S dicluster domain-containing protein [Dysgonamonadaceae bacterium]
MNIVYICVGIALLLWILGNGYRRRKNRNKVISVIENNCTGCGRCIKRCSRRVLETAKDETGIHAVVKYPDRCAACGDCLIRCKFNALKLIERS